MRRVFASLISFYQKWFSPWKGYSCAHRRLHGDYSCSEAVKQMILRNGLFPSLGNIRARFRACREAALSHRARDNSFQRGDLDCGLSGCVGCDGCGDMGVVDYCSGGTEKISFPSISITIPGVRISLGLIVVVFICFFWFYGRQVSSIDIKLIDAARETQDKKLINIFNSKLPDYQVILNVDAGEVRTELLSNVSASNWIHLKLNDAVYQSDIDTFTIVNKQILTADTLEVFNNPDGSGEGEYIEYKIRKR